MGELGCDGDGETESKKMVAGGDESPSHAARLPPRRRMACVFFLLTGVVGAHPRAPTAFPDAHSRPPGSDMRRPCPPRAQRGRAGRVRGCAARQCQGGRGHPPPDFRQSRSLSSSTPATPPPLTAHRSPASRLAAPTGRTRRRTDRRVAEEVVEDEKEETEADRPTTAGGGVGGGTGRPAPPPSTRTGVGTGGIRAGCCLESCGEDDVATE